MAAMTGGDVLADCLRAASKRILSVGSGDGTQQAAIVRSGHRNVVVTFYDAKIEVLRKYPTAKTCVDYLEAEGVTTQYKVDATNLSAYGLGKFDLIMFTFPHTGVPNADPSNVESNQQLLRSFLGAASLCLNPGGQVQITLKLGDPYDKWRLPFLLSEWGHTDVELELVSQHPLDKSLFPDYIHRTTKGTVPGWDGVVREPRGAQVHVFQSTAQTDADSVRVKVNVEPLGPLSDDEVKREVERILGSRPAPQTVLEIRRDFEPALMPDTRQLNRILYQMAAANQLTVRGADPSVPGKPTWQLSDS